MQSDAGLRRGEAAALVWDDAARWDDGPGRLCVGRSKTDAEARTVYLTPAAAAALEAMRPAGADGSAALFGLSAPWISRRIRAASAAAGLGSGFSGHSGRVGMARRRAAGKRRGWWRSLRARRRRGEPRSGWRRSVAAFMDCPPATLSAADGPPRAARCCEPEPLQERLQRLWERLRSCGMRSFSVRC